MEEVLALEKHQAIVEGIDSIKTMLKAIFVIIMVGFAVRYIKNK